MNKKTASFGRRVWLVPVIWLSVINDGLARCENGAEDASVPHTAPASYFTDHGDGTVTDSTTGLMWKRCSEDQVWSGKTCTGETTGYKWGDATFSRQLTYAGMNDWRLPDKYELLSIVEKRCASPTIDAEVFPATPGVWFWSSSPYAYHSDSAWGVHFGYGNASLGSKDYSFRVRLVRAGQ